MSMLVVAIAAATRHGPSVASVTTPIKDIATVVALIVGGLFTYLKFIKGRVLGPRASIKLTARLLSSPATEPSRFHWLRPTATETGTAIGIELCIRNSGQIQLRLPQDTELLLTISSITDQFAFTATDLTQEAQSWKHPDAYFAQTNLLLEEGEPPADPVTIEPSEEARFVALFPIPTAHHAVAYLAVVNCRIAFRSWFKTDDRWWDSRILVLPETSAPANEATEEG